jgi:Spy/CpxP family protein refolding chaperone
MKRAGLLLAVACAVVLAGTWLWAQDQPPAPRGGGPGGAGGPGGGPGRMMGAGPVQVALEIINGLDLTAEQKEKVEKMKTDFEAKMKEKFEAYRKDQEEARQYRQDHPDDRDGIKQRDDKLMGAMGSLREAGQAFIDEVKAVLNEDQLKKFNEQMAAKGGVGGGQGGRGGRVGGMGLLPPQVIDDLQLTDEQKEKMRGFGQAYLEEQRTLLDKYLGLIRDTLTPEQQEKFDKAVTELKNRIRGGGPGGGGPGGGGQGQGPRRQPPQKPDEGKQ